jgi:hypothetical protein
MLGFICCSPFGKYQVRSKLPLELSRGESEGNVSDSFHKLLVSKGFLIIAAEISTHDHE